MSIILEFILSICIFIYGIQLFSKGISNLVNEKVKNLLIKYTNTSLLLQLILLQIYSLPFLNKGFIMSTLYVLELCIFMYRVIILS